MGSFTILVREHSRRFYSPCMTVATRRFAAVVVCAATSLAFSVPAAHAQELTLRDGTGDVWVSSGAGFTRADGSKRADVTRVRVGHGAKRVVVTARLAVLAKRSFSIDGLRVQFRTNTGLRRDAMLSAQAGSRNGRVAFTSRTGKSPCTIAHKVDYVANTMMMSVPRSCLNSPRYVEFRSETSWTNTRKVFIDNPHDDQTNSKDWSNRVRRG